MLAAPAIGFFRIANLAGHALGFLSERSGREFTCGPFRRPLLAELASECGLGDSGLFVPDAGKNRE